MLILDVFLLYVAFLFSNYIKRGSFILPDQYHKLMLFFFICWLVTSFVANKYSNKKYVTYWSGAKAIFRSNFYLIYCVSFIIVFFGYFQFSRLHVFSTCVVLFLLNMGIWTLVHRLLPDVSGGLNGRKEVLHTEKSEKSLVSYRLITADLVLLMVAFFGVNMIKRGQLMLSPQYEKLLLLMVAMWFLSAVMTGKFLVSQTNGTTTFVWQWVKAGIIMLTGMAVLVYGLRLFHLSRFQSLGTVVVLMHLQGLLLFFLYGGRRQMFRVQDIESAQQVKQYLDQEPFDLNIDIEAIRRRQLAPACEKLETRLNGAAPKVYAFIDQHVDLNDILCLETALERTFEPIHQDIDQVPRRLLVNLHKLNDARRLNEFILSVHQSLIPGGYFVGYAHTIATHHRWVYGKFPRVLAGIVYGADFIFRRLMPKLPRVRKLYFMLTGGKNRAISRAELLGRLSFCGFDIVAEREIDNRFWVIAKKVKTSSFNTNPTYGPLITLNRSGCGDQMIRVYKLRTMHPYAEYLQNYVFDRQGLQEGGKLKDDFRVTTWGRVFRRLWIDELPMLYNWLRGDLKIVGVRPLSSHYLGLYDEELKALRKQTKPGLLPPFYVDLPKTFDEICESEKKYLRAYLKHPIRTDFYYFFKSLHNILIKRVRSN